MEFPLVVRMPYGGGVRAPELHDDSPETYYVHTPGVKVAIPSTPADAKGLLAAAIRDPDPVVVLEPKLHYRTVRGEVPEGEHVVPLGKARTARSGSDVTIVAYGSMVPLAERVADALESEASIEILDLRTLKPLDEEALLASAAKTGRVVIVQEAPRTCGYAAEVAAILAEKAILDLRGPVLRVTGYDVPYPYWQLEDAYMPSLERVVDAVQRLARVLMAVHELPLERRTLHGHFSRHLEPILTIDPGDSITFATLDAGWGLEPPRPDGTPRRKFEQWDPELDTGHALIGPVEVRGARAGTTLAVQIDRVRVGAYGFTIGGGFSTPAERPARALRWRRAPARLRARRGCRKRVRLRRTRARPSTLPRGHGHAAARAGCPSDRPAEGLGWQYRLQGARRRSDPLPADRQSTAGCSRPATATRARATAKFRN